MIKGVNKQIVEINYTNDEYIQKAILIINPSKSSLDETTIRQKADDYMQTVVSEQQIDYVQSIKEQALRLRKKQKITMSAICLTVLLIITLVTVIVFLI